MDTVPELPPPPYSEVDPQTPTLTPDSSVMGGGDYSPTSTARPTSSQSMRAVSFISLRGGYLRGVPFSEDPATNNYFQERAFQFSPERQLCVVHREITADTTRNDLKHPEFERDRDVLEQDWQTFVNYVLTELGNETSSSTHHKKLTPEEFYERQSKIEQLIAEWNESFFQSRSIKIIAHYYYKHAEILEQAQSANQTELASGLRRINIEDGAIDIPHIENRSHPVNHRSPWPVHQHGPFARGPPGFHHGPFMRGGPRAGLGFGFGRGAPHFQHGHEFGHRHGAHYARGRSHDSSRGLGRGNGRNRSRSRSSDSSSSSDSDTESEHQRGSRLEGRRGRREHRHEGRQRRSHSASSDSSITSVSSISSNEIDESTMRSVREAVTSFRLDPSNFQHSKMAYRQLLLNIQNQKSQARRNRSTIPREARTVSRAQRRALRDDLRKLRMELKSMSRTCRQAKKAAKREEKAARKQAKRERKQARKAEKIRVKAARKTTSPPIPASGQQALPLRPGRSLSIGQASINTSAPPYDMPGAFPETYTNAEYAEQAKQMEAQLKQWQHSLKYLHDVADEETRHITNAEKKEVALVPYKKEIAEVQREIDIIEAQVTELKRLAGTTPEETHRAGPTNINARQSSWAGMGNPAARVENYGEQLGRRVEGWGERFGRDMEAWGENFGREMERWGAEFGRNMSERGSRLGRGWSAPFASGPR